MADGDYLPTSWETIITQVVVNGQPERLRAAASGWTMLQDALTTMATGLDFEVGLLGQTWTGPAFDAYQAHMTGISDALRHVVEETQRMGSVVGTLTEAATQLETAQKNVFVPPLAIPEVDAAIAARSPVQEGLFQPKVVEETRNNAVAAWRAPIVPTTIVNTPWGRMTIEAYVARATEENRKVWVTLNDEVTAQSDMTPPGPTALPPATTGAGASSLAVAGPTGGPAVPPPALPGAGAPPPGATVPPSETGTSAPGTGVPSPGTGAPATDEDGALRGGGTPSLNADTGGFDPAVSPAVPAAGAFGPGTAGAAPGAVDPPEFAGTGLAGAGAGAGLGGVSGAGSSGGIPGGLSGGAPAGATTGSPAGSVGGLPIGAGGAPLSGGAGGAPGRRGIPSVSAAPGVSPVAPAHGAGGAGGAGRGGKPVLEGGVPHAGGAAGRPGTPGAGGFGGAAGSGFGDEDEHTTWLEEDDENVWGYGSGVPGVLR
ncbi:WXG100 family type VII secretion target [Catenuloplanes sp. NPDC051500]|uniref:WXG100 family type VII secretion target n=1 Tax=Catenuloplanes sp. NPDC051500 TaxID=3363959 RepID=UPI0037B25CD6